MRQRWGYGALGLRFLGVALGLFLPGLAEAEDRDAILRDVTARAAALATEWKADLETAVQAVAPQALPFDLEVTGEGLDDPFRDVAYVYAAGLAGEGRGGFSDAGCVRMGPETLAFYRSSPEFRGGAKDMFVGDTFLDRPEIRAEEVHVLEELAFWEQVAPLTQAQMILQCDIVIMQVGPVTQREWAALEEGLATRFDGITKVEGRGTAHTFGLGDWGNHLAATSAQDPATQVAWFRVMEAPEGATGAPDLNSVIISFVVWRAAVGS